MIRGNVIKNKKPPEIKVSLEASIHNRFDVEIIDSRTGKVKQKAKAFNIICNQLWSNLGGYFKYIHFGAGDGTPSQSDTSLFSFIGSRSVNSISGESAESFSFSTRTGVFSVKRSIKILENEYVGRTFTEVGVASGSSSTSLCTHAMLQDMNGNKISIEKTETDIINIYATIFVHVNPLGYDNGSIFFDVNKKTYTVYCSYMHYFAGVLDLGSQYAYFYSNLLDEGNYGASVGGSATFDVTSKKLKIIFSRLPAASGNFENGILRINTGRWYNGTWGSNYLQFLSFNITENSQWFSKSVIENEAVGTGDGTTKDFALKFPYASNVEIFVDGVQTTDFTVEYGVNATELLPFMERLHSFSTAEHHVLYFRYANYFSGNSSAIYYNPMNKVGIGFVKLRYSSDAVKVEVSNDLSSWTYVMDCKGSTSYAVPEQYQKYKYWKFTETKGSTTYLPDGLTGPSSYTGKVLHFTNPPAEGAVITANYKSKCIAKNENNVFDFTIEIQAGEYVE